MKCHRHVQVISRESAEIMARYVESFAGRRNGWSLPADNSREYQQHVGEPACCIVFEESVLPRSALHFAQDRPNRLSLTNIVPLEKNELNVDEYNDLAQRFVIDLRKAARADLFSLTIHLSQSEIKLKDVLGGKITTKFFHQFKGAHPLSGHPNDIRRLDMFTCAVSRYSRKSFDFSAFEHLLIEELHWSRADANWCRERVEVGLEVLAANKRF